MRRLKSLNNFLSATESLLVFLDGLRDDLERALAPEQLQHLHRLAFKLLVDAEKVLDLLDDVRRKIGHVAEHVPRRLLERHRDHLDVLRPLVDHQYVTDRIAPDQRHRRDLLAAQHQYVQRVPVVRIGARDKTVVRRIVRRRVQDAIQNEHPRLFVDFVFVLAPLGDLDHRDEIFGRDALRRNVVPNVHNSSPPPPAASSWIKLYYTSPPIAIVLDIFFVILLPKPFFCANIIEQIAPKWWNWQTRRTQNPVMATSCGFKSRLRHQQRKARPYGKNTRLFCCLIFFAFWLASSLVRRRDRPKL